MSGEMRRLTIRISQSLRRELLRVSREQRRSASDLVRDALRRYVAVQQFQSLRAKTMPFAEAQGYVTDANVFECVS
jgi:predicted transcriptional regulator